MITKLQAATVGAALGVALAYVAFPYALGMLAALVILQWLDARWKDRKEMEEEEEKIEDLTRL